MKTSVLTWTVLLCMHCAAQPIDSTNAITEKDSVGFVDSVPDSIVIYPLVPTEKLFFSQPSYRISIGASFDFIETLKPSNVYGDLMIDIPDVVKGKKWTSGFFGGIYQLRNIAIDSFIPDRVFLTSSTPLGGPGIYDSTLVRLSTAKGSRKSQLDNLYFFASFYRPWYLKNKDVPGSSGLYHMFRLGTVRSRLTTQDSYTRTTNDTVFITADPNYPLLPREVQTQTTWTNWEVGFGQMLRHEFDDLALQVFGMVTTLPQTWDLGYILSFNAIGSRSGLIVGAEIRTDPNIEDQLYNIFLAKTIKVKDLAKLITSY